MQISPSDITLNLAIPPVAHGMHDSLLMYLNEDQSISHYEFHKQHRLCHQGHSTFI